MGVDFSSDPILRPLAGTDGRVRLRHIELKKRLGAGGMGAIYLGYHAKLDLDVAVKVLAYAQAASPGARERFLLEARSAAKVDHPNLVRVYDVDEEAAVHYIVMEYVRGSDAARIMKAEGPFSEDRALEIARAAADALRAAHAKGIVHRDVKPDNILIREEDGAVKLADLGIAKVRAAPDSQALTATGEVFGTPAYMSPEQIESSSSVDARADIYSLGATLYALLAGKAPFKGDSPFALMRNVCEGKCEDIASLRPDISPRTCAFVRGTMKLRPEERPASMAEIVEGITALRQGRPAVRAAPVAGTLDFGAPLVTRDIRRLEMDGVKAEAMGDLSSALKKYRQILEIERIERVAKRAEEIEAMLPLWRARQSAGAALPGGRWDLEEELVDLVPGLAGFRQKIVRIALPSLETESETALKRKLARLARDGRALVAGYLDGRVERLTEEGSVSWRARPSRKAVSSLAVCERGGMAASGHADGTIGFLRLADGKSLASARGHSGAASGIAFLESGGARTVVSAGADGVMKRWHPSGRELAQLSQELSGPVAFSKTTALARLGDEIVAWAPPWKDARGLVGSPGDVSALALDVSGVLLVLATPRGEVVLCSTAAGEELWRTDALQYEPRGVFFAQEGRVLVAWSAHEVRTWEMPTKLFDDLRALQR